jgi:tRNA dimethylallyltransferase
MGPTATGKTDLAMALADRLPLGLVSVDSAMVYRYLDIGSGKPAPDVLARYPHQLVDIRDPWEQYSAGEFAATPRRQSAPPSGRIPPGGRSSIFPAWSGLPSAGRRSRRCGGRCPGGPRAGPPCIRTAT